MNRTLVIKNKLLTFTAVLVEVADAGAVGDGGGYVAI